MGFSTLQRTRVDLRAWFAFLLGAVACALALSYGEVRKEPSGLLVFDAVSTRPGTLKVFYTKGGQLTDPDWAVNFQQSNTKQAVSFPLGAGQYGLVGFKPMIEAGGQVSISKLRILSASGVRNIGEGNFVGLNQLDILSSQNGETVIAPAQGANDPFGAYPNLHELVPQPSFAFKSLLWIVAGKLSLIAAFVALVYGLSGNLPFARGMPNEPRPEPGLSQWLGMVAVGLIVLYLRNAYSITFPVLYAEDGAWSAGLINRGFIDMLFNARPQADYFVFGNVLLMALALLSNTLFFGHNLTYLPHFISLFAMLFYALLAVVPVILLRKVLRIEARLLLWLFVLLVPLGDSSYEVLGRLANVGFAFLFLAFCLLIYRRHSLQDASRKRIVATDSILFLCANTNPLCYPLIVIDFGVGAWGNWKSNGRKKILVWLSEYAKSFSAKSALVLLATIFLTAIWIALRLMLGEGPSASSGRVILASVPEAIIARSFLYPFIFSIYSCFDDIESVFALIAAVSVIVLLVKNMRRERLMLGYAAAVFMAGTALTVGSRPYLTIVLDQYRTTFPDRYYFGLTLFVYLMVAFSVSAGFRDDKKSWRKITANLLSGLLVALYIGNVTFSFEFAKPRFPYLPKMTFLEEVEKSYKEGTQEGPNGLGYRVNLDPPQKTADFPAEYVFATVLGVRSLPSAISDTQPRVSIQLSKASSSYDGRVVSQKPAGRGREDGWFYVSGGVRSWIPDGSWLKQKNLSPADVIEITSDEFDAIPDSGVEVK
jgi:hypothetical protein